MAGRCVTARAENLRLAAATAGDGDTVMISFHALNSFQKVGKAIVCAIYLVCYFILYVT